MGKRYSQGTIENFSGSNKEKYEVVIATEVIEHVVDPVAFIEYSLKVLKHGEVNINNTNQRHSSEGTIWETESAPVHLWWFTEKGIGSIAQYFNAKASFIDFTDYTKNKIWSVHVGTANSATRGPVINKDRTFARYKKKVTKSSYGCNSCMDVYKTCMFIP